MSRDRHQRRSDAITKIVLHRYNVRDLFTDEEIIDLMNVAKGRIARVFMRESELYRGKIRGTDNYIHGVSSRQSELARYITFKSRGSFISREMLALNCIIPPKQLDALIKQLEYQVILLQLNVMCSAPHYEVYFEERCGVWQIIQSVTDEARGQRRAARRVKQDDRSFHGRVRSQSNRRGVAPGTSISTA